MIPEGALDTVFTFANYMNFVPDEQQSRVMSLYQFDRLQPHAKKKRRMSIRSGQGCGKTAVTNIIALHYTLSAPDAMTVITSPTMRQCRDVWFNELRRNVQKGPKQVRDLLTITNTSATVANREQWCIKSITASKQEAFAGLHADHLMIIEDESSGIAQEIDETIKGTLTGPNNFHVKISNPTQRSGPFYNSFQPREAHMWHRAHLDARKSRFVDPENVKRIADEYGEDSDVYRIRVEGEFPVTDPHALFALEDLQQARPQFQPIPGLEPRQFGIDLARFGGDESVVYQRSNNQIMDQYIVRRQEPLHVAEESWKMAALARWDTNPRPLYVLDAGGLGQGVIANFYAREHSSNVYEFHFGGKSPDAQFSNQITHAYFILSKLVKQRMAHIPDDPVLHEQLSERLYFTDPKGKLQLERKEDYIKRTKNTSPDRADALALAYYPCHTSIQFAQQSQPERQVFIYKLGGDAAPSY